MCWYSGQRTKGWFETFTGAFSNTFSVHQETAEIAKISLLWRSWNCVFTLNSLIEMVHLTFFHWFQLTRSNATSVESSAGLIDKKTLVWLLWVSGKQPYFLKGLSPPVIKAISGLHGSGIDSDTSQLFKWQLKHSQIKGYYQTSNCALSSNRELPGTPVWQTHTQINRNIKTHTNTHLNHKHTHTYCTYKETQTLTHIHTHTLKLSKWNPE